MTATMTRNSKTKRRTPRYSKMGFKPGHIAARTEAGTSEVVSAFILGSVAIHRELYLPGGIGVDKNERKRKWVVTHIPTGMAIPLKFKTKSVAERIARVFARVCHGTPVDPSKTERGRKFWNAFKSWMRDN